MSERFETMRQLLDSAQYFKLVCGAGNENAEEVKRLSTIYTLAGATGMDVSATPQIVEACMEGIDLAYNLADKLDIKVRIRPFITVSVGMPGDHHVRKAIIEPNCVSCNLCIPACPTDAITDDLTVIRELCIGCGDCEAVCPPKVSAIGYDHDDKALKKILPMCLAAGAENIELHAAVSHDDAIMDEWNTVCEVQPNHFVSLCLDRLHLSNFQLIDRIRKAKEIAGDRLIVQADGVPMSGGTDNFNTTLQAIAIADIINKDIVSKERSFRNLPILISGGTNSYTGKLLNICGVNYHGVSIGTHARAIVKDYIISDDFDSDPGNLKKAVSVARKLVDQSLNPSIL